MKVSVAINNYNYSKYLIECIDSVLNQTYKYLEIIVVDDGSTDDSLKILHSQYADNPHVKIVAKQNGGQLSAFNEVLQHITGEIVFFLDADDLYKEDYIETILKIYDTNEEIDFIFCALEKFFPDGTTELLQRYKKSQYIGYSILSYLYYRKGIGGETSTVSMKFELLRHILPIPLENDWITRADECLTWASSLHGAKKYYHHEPLVKYRIHKENFYSGKKFSTNYLYNYHRLNIENRFFNYLLKKYDIDEKSYQQPANARKIIDLVLMEYKSSEVKTFKILKLYLRIIWQTNIHITTKIQKSSKLTFLYFNSETI